MKLFSFAIALLFFMACQKTEMAAHDNNFSSTLAISDAVNFKGLCTWSVEYSNTAFDLKLNNLNQTVLTATITTTMKEKVVTGNCIPASQQSQHSYALSAFFISGNSLIVYFKQDDSSFPQNIASFTGIINASDITGILTFYRKSDGIFCKVEMPLQLSKNG
ncbi:MAG: hypothetical protein IT249_08865 [Chitinophagaceae bacterium]|nr:hypothetical protein [Chitinophagaceae bacterium]